MTYTEYKNTYKQTIKTFPSITELFTDEPQKNIGLTITNQVKNGTKWRTTDTDDSKVTFIHYTNILDGIPFMRNLGGYEKVTKAYTKKGYLPIKVESISPDRTKKTVFQFTF